MSMSFRWTDHDELRQLLNVLFILRRLTPQLDVHIKNHQNNLTPADTFACLALIFTGVR